MTASGIASEVFGTADAVVSKEQKKKKNLRTHNLLLWVYDFFEFYAGRKVWYSAIDRKFTSCA